MTEITKTLYIPIEIVDRELGGAILLSAEALSRGWLVILGGKQGIFNNMSRFRNMPGVFFLKSIVPGEVFKQKEIMADGHRIVSLDVEGLAPSNGEAGVRLRYSDASIDLTDLLFFWGRSHYDSVRAVYPRIEAKSVVTGSPIIDEILVRGRRAREAGRTSDRKRILIGTSCGYANHMNGIEFSRKMTRDAYGKNVDAETSRTLEFEALLDEKVFEYWKEAVPRIGDRFRACDVVLRPHPSENKDFWRAHLKGHGNIRIDEGQSILEEMLKADVYIHFNSTSSLTSNILGIPTFMPLPAVRKELEERITFVKDISITTRATEDLLEKIQERIAGSGIDFKGADLSRYCENLAPGSAEASRVIMDALEKTYSPTLERGPMLSQALREGLIGGLRKSKLFMMWSAGVALSTVGIDPGQRFPPKNVYKSSNSKQPDTGLDKVQRMMGELLEKKQAGSISVEKKSRNLFVMTGRSR